MLAFIVYYIMYILATCLYGYVTLVLTWIITVVYNNIVYVRRYYYCYYAGFLKNNRI